jgi:purine-cytosine permease-like protein
MKFSKKGKWVIPIIAFIVSALGIYVYELLTLWHSIILMVLLLLITAILLQRMDLFSSSADKNFPKEHITGQEK